MPRIIHTALWSPEEILALQHGKPIQTIVNGEEIFHQAERPRRSRVEVLPPDEPQKLLDKPRPYECKYGCGKSYTTAPGRLYHHKKEHGYKVAKRHQHSPSTRKRISDAMVRMHNERRMAQA